jgi:hypothetical protein
MEGEKNSPTSMAPAKNALGTACEEIISVNE